MPKTKTQRIVFGILMSFFMAYGMEVYNIAIRMGYNLTEGQGFSSITYPVFLEALKEAVGMSVIVFIVSNLVGNRAGAAFMAKYCVPDKDNPYFCRVMRQAGTILVMCPLMSLIASILFQVILGGQLLFRLPAIWIGTTMKNFPMAFFWNMFVAAPLIHWIFEKMEQQSPLNNPRIISKESPRRSMGAHKTVILKITIMASVRRDWQRNNGYLVRAGYPLFFCRHEKQ